MSAPQKSLLLTDLFILILNNEEEDSLDFNRIIVRDNAARESQHTSLRNYELNAEILVKVLLLLFYLQDGLIILESHQYKEYHQKGLQLY